MSSRDRKIKRTLLESGLGLLAKEYEKNPSYGHTRVHDNMVPWALRALGTKMVYYIISYNEPMDDDRPDPEQEAEIEPQLLVSRIKL